MYSLNVPVPGRVAALASNIARELPEATPRIRGEHTLGVKRLYDDEHARNGQATGVGRGGNDAGVTNGGRGVDYNRLEARTRELLRGQPAFEARVVELDYFSEAVTGSSPVVYLAVESPGLVELHRRLAETFDPLEEIEGDGYTPHVTVARGGSLERAKQVTERDIEPIRWTVSKLAFWDARRRQSVSTVSLPA